MKISYSLTSGFNNLLGRRGSPPVIFNPDGINGAPVLSGLFRQGQVVYSNFTVTDPYVEQVEQQWLYNGVVVFGELGHTYLQFSEPTVGDTLVHRVRAKSGATWTDWVSSNTLTYSAPVEPSTRYFGALTYAGAGGFPLPAGKTSITDAGGTNLTVVSGYVVPATTGVTSGTITYNDNTTQSIIAVANSRSVRDKNELRTAMQATDLTRGVSKILLRGGVEYNPERSRHDVSLPVGGIAGVVDVGYVVVTGHSNEPKPVIVSLGFNGLNRPDERSEHAFNFDNIIFGGQPLTDLEIEDPNVEKSMVIMRSGTPQNEMVRGLLFTNCYFGIGGTDAPADWKRRTTAVGDQSVNHFNQFVNCVFDRVSYGLRYSMHTLVSGCKFFRFSRDAIISNVSGSVFEWNEFGRAQITHEEFTNPTIVSNAPGNLVLELPDADFFSIATQSSREDGRWIITAGDGTLASYVGEDGYFVSGSTVQNGTTVGININIPDAAFSGTTTWKIRLSSFHADMIQSTRRDGVVYERSPVSSRYPGYDAAYVGNSLHPGDWPEFGSTQGIFNENQNGLDSARTLVIGNTITSVYAHGAVFPDQGSFVVMYNTIASARYPNAVAGVSANNGDGGTGTKVPEDCLALGNIWHNFNAQGATGASINSQISQARNQYIASDGSNVGSLFEDPDDWSVKTYYDPLSIQAFNNFRVLDSLGTQKIGAAGNVNVSYPNKTVTLEPVAYGARVTSTGTTGVLSVSGRNLVAGDTVYWCLSNVPGNDYSNSQAAIKSAATSSGALPSGSVACGVIYDSGVTSRWSDTVPSLSDGAYKLHVFSERTGSSVSDSVVLSSPVFIYSTATQPTIDNISVVRGSTTTDQIQFTDVPVTLGGTNVYAFAYHRGLGNISYIRYNETNMTNLATDVTLATSNRYSIRGIVNPADAEVADLLMDGVSFSTTGNAAIALITASAADTFVLGGTSITSGTSISNTINVKAGDKVVTWLTTTNGDFGAITWTGLTLESAAAPCGSTTSHAALAIAEITADNAAYPIGASFVNTRNNVCLVHAILRKA